MFILLNEGLLNKHNDLKPDFKKFKNYYYFIKKSKKVKLKSRDIDIIGDIDYFVFNDKKYFADEVTEKQFQELNDAKLENIDEFIEGDYILVIREMDKLYIVLDKFSKQDVFYYIKDGKVLISDSLEYFYKIGLTTEYSQEALLNFFTVYGNYAPKKHTLFQDIKRLGHREYFKISEKDVVINELLYEIHNIEDYDEIKLDEYYNYLRDAVYYRSSRNGTNWVYLSGGWDSTAILAFLREMYDNTKIKGVIGKMQYSKRSGVINQFELDRASAFAQHYGIELSKVDLDYTTNDTSEYFDNISELLKYKNIYSLNSCNFGKLSDFIGDHANSGDSVFTGEISDGVHNFGFAQYATILDHPDLDFREYADKMATYLFGPSFFSHTVKNHHDKDLVYNFLKSRYEDKSFEKVIDKDVLNNNKKLLASFFISKARIPFYNNNRSKLYTENTHVLYEALKTEYLDKFAKLLNEKNIYSILLNLYNSFHWQGSTIKTISKSLERYGYGPKLPFWDRYLQRFMSKMPESWGRGLNFNSTKYPLKQTLKTKLKYPLHLQKGPHSYLYDVNPGFSHLEELIIASELTGSFKSKLENIKIEDYLDKDYFNLPYINGICKNYIYNKKIQGSELNDLFSVILLSKIS